MDLSLTPEQEMLRNIARDFVSRECPQTLVRQLDEGAGDGFSRDLWQKMAGLGWVGVIIPVEYGGGGHALTDLAVLYEEMGRGVVPGPHHSSGVLAALILLQAGSEEQKRSLLPAIAQGQQILGVAVTEPDYGWEASSIRLRAAVDADGGFTVNGSKLFVHDAAVADLFIVAVRTGGEGEEGITLLLIDRRASGLTIRQLEPGFSGERQYELTFENVRVPAEGVIGTPGNGWAVLQKAFIPATAVLCAYMVGGLQEVYERTVSYCRTRQQFGVAIGTFQRVQDHVVEIVNHLDAARWTTYEALWKLDTGQEGAEEAVHIAKAVTSEAYDEGTFHSHEIHAGIGISKEYGLHLYTKKARTLFNYLGDPSYHRSRIAESLAL